MYITAQITFKYYDPVRNKLDIYCRVYLNMCTVVWHILTKIQYMEETLGKTSILHCHKVLKVDISNFENLWNVFLNFSSMHCFEFFRYFTPKNIIENFHCDQILRNTAKSKKKIFEILYCTVYICMVLAFSKERASSVINKCLPSYNIMQGNMFYTCYRLNDSCYRLHATCYRLHDSCYFLHDSCYVIHATCYVIHATYYRLHDS